MKNYKTTINMETIEKFNAMKQTMLEMMDELQCLYDEKTDEIDEYCGVDFEDLPYSAYEKYEALNRDVKRIKWAIEALDDALDMYLV